MYVMKKFLLFVCLMCGMMAALQAQTVVFSDNFDSYTAGQQLCSQNNTDWTTWSNAPGTAEDAVISTEQASSGSNSLKVTGTNDIIYRFSNQTTGVFDVDFDYYVPTTGSGAYFNIQHYYNPGVQWAFECYFTTSGTGYFSVAGTTYNFTMPNNAWFHVKAHIDLDQDLITMTVNNVVVQSWPFSNESNSANGINQLGSINFYAGAPNNATGTYYVDNFVFTEITSANDGQFSFSPTSDINVTVDNAATGTYALTLSNPGGAPVNYRLVPYYEFTPNTTSTGSQELTRAGTEYTGVLFNNTEAIQVAAGFTAEEVVSMDLVGKQINAINVSINNSDYINVAKIRIYDMGGILVDGPGDMVYEQNFVPVDGVNTINLTTPYVLNGRDFWFGIYYEQDPTQTTLPSIGLDDAVTPHPYGNWYKTGVAWNELNGNPDLTGNWMLSAIVDGTPIEPWITVSSPSGTINAGGQVTETITFVNPDHPAECTKTAHIALYSNDITNQENVLDVSVSFHTVGIDENQIMHISLYPNPASDYLKVTGDAINCVEVFDMNGKMVWSAKGMESEYDVDVRNWSVGTYMVRVNNSVTKKIVVK